jgi:type IV secretory pathway VirB2 component (pilin)
MNSPAIPDVTSPPVVRDPRHIGSRRSARSCAVYKRLSASTALLTIMMHRPPAYASGSSMPWEATRSSRSSSRSKGPVAKIVAVMIIIIATGLDARLRRYVEWRLPQADPDRLRPLDRLRRVELLPVVLLLWRRGARLMADAFEQWRRGAGLHGARPPRSDRAHPARRRPAIARHPQRHAGRPRSALGLRLWLVGSRPLGGRPFHRPSGPPAVTRSSSRSCRRHLRIPAFLVGLREATADDEPCRIS